MLSETTTPGATTITTTTPGFCEMENQLTITSENRLDLVDVDFPNVNPEDITKQFSKSGMLFYNNECCKLIMFDFNMGSCYIVIFTTTNIVVNMYNKVSNI